MQQQKKGQTKSRASLQYRPKKWMHKRLRRRSTTWSHERNNADRNYKKNRDNKSQAFHTTDQPSSRGLTLIVYPSILIYTKLCTNMNGCVIKNRQGEWNHKLIQQG